MRNDNQIKYAIVSGGFMAELQYSLGEGVPSTTWTGKSWGAMARYAVGGLALGGAVLERRDDADRKANGYTLGAGYTSGKLYLNAAWARNSFDDGVNTALLLVGSGIENSIAPARPGQSPLHVDKRDMWSFGGMYEVLPALQVGAQYWGVHQRYHTAGVVDGKARFLALLADYGLSKRTDIYATIDHTSVTDMQLTSTPTGAPNGADSRTSVMLGIRHRF
jgi:predicted porin